MDYICHFFTHKLLCQARETADLGFFVSVEYQLDSLFAAKTVELELVGEWAGKIKRKKLQLNNNQSIGEVGPFSCLSAFKISRQTYETFNGEIKIEVSRNDFIEPLLNTSRRNVNVAPTESFYVQSDDFCNLILPDPYNMYLLGWIEKTEFLERYRKYPSWVWPDDKVDRTMNRQWTQITERDRTLMDRLDIEFQQSLDSSVPAGLMKTHGRGGGACCYVFPNIPLRGGVNETNLYVLPRDLQPMETLVR